MPTRSTGESLSGLSSDVSELTEDLLDVFGRALRVGVDVVQSVMSGSLTGNTTAQLRRLAGAMPAQISQISGLLTPGTKVSSGGCGCDIPPPCWMPDQLSGVTSHLCPGGTARLRLHVTNCGMGQRSVTVTVSGPGAGGITFTPQALSLGPFEDGTITLSLAVPSDAGEDWSSEALVWVHGCREHVARWTVSVSDRGCSTTHQLDVEDCPDLVHHWYDHFYCARPCAGELTHA